MVSNPPHQKYHTLSLRALLEDDMVEAEVPKKASPAPRTMLSESTKQRSVQPPETPSQAIEASGSHHAVSDGLLEQVKVEILNTGHVNMEV